MKIASELLELIEQHALSDAPNECCGVVISRDGVAESVHALENLAASPFRFEVDGPALAKLMDEAEADGAQLGAIYHSHTRSDPVPSQTDVNFAQWWPGVEWIIVGTVGGTPVSRSWLIEGGEHREVPLEVTG